MTGDAPTSLARAWYLAVPPAHPQSLTLAPAGWEWSEMGTILQGSRNVEAGHPARVWSETLFPPQAPCRADYGMAEAMHPHCLTEIQWPGTDPRVCHSQGLRI